MRHLFTLLIAASLTACHPTAEESPRALPLDRVTLTASPFFDAQQRDIDYLLALDADRLIAPYRKEAGLPPKAENYPNWENTGLDGHIGGHYLAALAQMTAATHDPRIEARLDYVLQELKLCQERAGDGYLCGVPNGRKIWQEIHAGDIRAGRFNLNEGWVPLYNIHKIFAGLRDACLIAHRAEAKEMLTRLTDWFYAVVEPLRDEQIQQMLYSEHGGLNEVFADVAALTGDERHLRLAVRFSDEELLRPLLLKQDSLTGKHANTQIPKVIGYQRIAELMQRDDWHEAARYFWEQVVTHRTISIGGNSVREHFHPAEDFSSMLTSEQGPETCNTYNMLRLTKLLYEAEGDARYIDYYERALYNHILSTQHPETGGLVYFTPMRAGHYRVYSQPHTSFWCCVGSGLENHARYGEMIYAEQGSTLTVNLFIPSEAQWEYGRIEQQTRLPEEEATTLIIHPSTEQATFSLRLRIPAWCSEPALTLNGKRQPLRIRNGYLTLRRKWQEGDRVTLQLPMQLAAEQLPDGSANYSFSYGPIVLAAALSEEGQTGLFADESRGGHIAQGRRLPLDEMPCLVGTPETLLAQIKKGSEPLRFTLHGLYPAHFEGLELVPFHRLYATRYALYFPLRTQEELAAFQSELAIREAEREALDRATTDRVVCGEQQPESDHFVRMERSQIGHDDGRPWRETTARFSYRMQPRERACKVRIAYRAEFMKEAVVTVEDIELGRLTDNEAGEEAVAEFPLPESLQQNPFLRITIGKGNQKITPHIYEVRLVE